MNWDTGVKDQFEYIIAKIPVFMRGFAQDKVMKQLAIILAKDQRALITEKDLVDAFFTATPFGFHGPLKTDMEELGIDYKKYTGEQ